MTQQSILSGDEIAALTGRPDVSSAGRDGGSRPFAFGASAAPAAALPALDRLNDRLARRMRDVLEPFLRARPRVDAEPAVLRPLVDWQAEQPVFAGFSTYSIKPLKGQLAIAIPSEFVSRVVDAFYGGAGLSPAVEASEFTPTEERLHARLADALIAELAAVWREAAPFEPSLKGRETNVALAGIGPAGEGVAICRFTITTAQGRPTAIDLVLPAAALRAIENAFIAKSGDPKCPTGDAWRARLGEALGDVRVEARTVLARPELNVSELMQLKVGDVIPVSIPALVPLLVEGRTVALGSIGEHDGKAALKIEKIETRRIAA